MEQEKKKKKFSWWPFFLWLFIARYITRHISEWTWMRFLENTIILLPTVPVYYFSAWLVNKKAYFFRNFRERPLLWYGIGIFYFFGSLLFQKSLILSACLFASAIPLFPIYSHTMYDCETRWQVLTFILGMICMILSYKNILLALFFALCGGIAGEYVANKLFD